MNARAVGIHCGTAKFDYLCTAYFPPPQGKRKNSFAASTCSNAGAVSFVPTRPAEAAAFSEFVEAIKTEFSEAIKKGLFRIFRRHKKGGFSPVRATRPQRGRKRAYFRVSLPGRVVAPPMPKTPKFGLFWGNNAGSILPASAKRLFYYMI